MLVIALSAVVMALGVQAIQERNERTRDRLLYLAAKAQKQAASGKDWKELYARQRELLTWPPARPDRLDVPPFPPCTTPGADPWFENQGSQPDLPGPVFRQLENWEPDSVRYGTR